MKTTLAGDAAVNAILEHLAAANRRFNQRYPGEPEGRQPIHTVYGGAQLFTAETARKMGELALRALAEHGPDHATFARALALPGATSLPTSAAEIAAQRAQL